MQTTRTMLSPQFAAALGGGFMAAFQAVVSKHLHHGVVPLQFYMTTIALALLSFFIIALPLRKFWNGTKCRVIVGWVLVAFLGSVLFVLARLGPGIVGGWFDPLRLEPSLFGYIAEEASAAASVILMLCLLTLPIIASTYSLAYFLLKRDRRSTLS